MRFPRVIYKGLPKRNSWCRWAVFRVMKRNNSTNVRFVGDTGSGKTYSGLSFGELCAALMNKQFDGDNLYFSLKDVIDKVANDDPKPGTIFFIDEQQIGASSKKHQSKNNQAYSAFLSTVRSKRYIIITTLPFSDMEDKQTRRLFHVEIETQGVNLTTNTVRCKPRFVEHSRVKKDKTYWKRLVIVFTDPETGVTKSRKLDYWDVPRPSQKIIDIYEARKSEFQRKLYRRLSAELSIDDESDDVMPKASADQTVEQILTPYQQAILRHLRAGIKSQKEINQKILDEGEFNSTKEKISINIKWMRKKGVIIIK